jgi:tRNA modification GTPase
VSSGRPPAAIAVLRISGSAAVAVATRLAGTLPPARQASLRTLRDIDGGVLDRALLLVFPGPRSATGEDLVEIHCHGGRAVVAAIEQALGQDPATRRAEAGEFTRRALLNGRIDLAEAEGLADLLAAESERQRIAALSASEGHVSACVREWLQALAEIAARVEAELDFSDEDDVAASASSTGSIAAEIAVVRATMRRMLEQPPVERLRDGISVVIGGPPNSGKSTLINLLAERDVAIVSPISGTTRDRIEAPVMRDGLAYVLSDTAGLTDDTDDAIEQIGVGRATAAIAAADLLIWLGDDPPPRDAIWVHAQADRRERRELGLGKHLAIAASKPATITALWTVIGQQADALVPAIDAVAFNERQRQALCDACATLEDVSVDLLITAEQLRRARRSLGALLGIDIGEQLLDTLFGRFCIGK